MRATCTEITLSLRQAREWKQFVAIEVTGNRIAMIHRDVIVHKAHGR